MTKGQTTEEIVHELTTDVTAQRVARVYAEALLKAAEKRNAADEVLEELRTFVLDLFAREPLFEQFLSSSAVDRQHKTQLLQSIFQGKISDLLYNFLMVLNTHDRLELLRTILLEYRDLNDQHARRMRVQVQSAAPLPDDQRDRLVRELRETFRLEPILEE